jgi:hypothetical protein
MWGDLVLGAQADYFELLAHVCEARRGNGYVAVRSGIFSNIENGVAADRADSDTIAELIDWLGGLPASWVARAPEPSLPAARSTTRTQTGTARGPCCSRSS